MSGRLTKVTVPKKGLPDTEVEIWFDGKTSPLILSREVFDRLRDYKDEEKSSNKKTARKEAEEQQPSVDFTRWEGMEIDFIVCEEMTKVFDRTQSVRVKGFSSDEEDRILMVIEMERHVPGKGDIPKSCEELIPDAPWKVTRVRYNLVPSNSLTLSTIHCLEAPEPEDLETETVVNETQQPVAAYA